MKMWLFQRVIRRIATTRVISTILWVSTPTPRHRSSALRHIRCVLLRGRLKPAARTLTSGTTCHKDSTISTITTTMTTMAAPGTLHADSATMNLNLCSTTVARRTTRNITGVYSTVLLLHNNIVTYCTVLQPGEKPSQELLTIASSIGAEEMDNINVISSVQKTWALLYVISCMEGFVITSPASL